MTIQPTRRPLVPEDVYRNRPADHLWRAATALFLARAQRNYIDEVVKQWPDDRSTKLLLKAATTPASTITSGWAAELAGTAVADAVVGLAPVSAAAELIRRGLRLGLEGFGAIIIPTRIVTAADAGSFYKESMPIQVRSYNLSGPTLERFQLGVIATFTNELATRAVQDVEPLIKQILSESAALALDAAILSTSAAAPDIRPAGILNGVTPITAAAGGGMNALTTDITALVQALAVASGGVAPLFITHPRQVATLKLTAGAKFDYPVLGSAVLAPGTVIAVEPDSFVSTLDSVPEFNTSDEATLHEESTPLPIGSVGAPDPIMASPTRSLWQTDCTAVRMILRIGWAMRAPHVAVINNVTW